MLWLAHNAADLNNGNALRCLLRRVTSVPSLSAKARKPDASTQISDSALASPLHGQLQPSLRSANSPLRILFYVCAVSARFMPGKV
jgi:hypothetical protein